MVFHFSPHARQVSNLGFPCRIFALSRKRSPARAGIKIPFPADPILPLFALPEVPGKQPALLVIDLRPLRFLPYITIRPAGRCFPGNGNRNPCRSRTPGRFGAPSMFCRSIDPERNLRIRLPGKTVQPEFTRLNLKCEGVLI